MYFYLIFSAIMSLASFFLYALDKSKAKHGKWRIKESVLLGFGFFGGAVGALIAMKLFRHKTKHLYFWAINIMGLAAQVAVFIIFFVI